MIERENIKITINNDFDIDEINDKIDFQNYIINDINNFKKTAHIPNIDGMLFCEGYNDNILFIKRNNIEVDIFNNYLTDTVYKLSRYGQYIVYELLKDIACDIFNEDSINIETLKQNIISHFNNFKNMRPEDTCKELDNVIFSKNRQYGPEIIFSEDDLKYWNGQCSNLKKGMGYYNYLAWRYNTEHNKEIYPMIGNKTPLYYYNTNDTKLKEYGITMFAWPTSINYPKELGIPEIDYEKQFKLQIENIILHIIEIIMK